MTIKLQISKGRLRVRDIITAEHGFTGDTMGMAKFLARFVVNGDGNYLSEERALDLILDLDLAELPEVTKQLTAEIKRLQEGATPLATEES